MPKINEIWFKFEGFQYAKSNGLNRGYYNIRFSKNSSSLCTIILTWGKYSYKRLPLGFANSPDISQQEMNDLFHGFLFICAYIYDVLLLTKEDFTDHVQKIEVTINKLK